MTVSYTADVANASGFGCFTKILLRWKGSVYKLIYKELSAYLLCYFIINTIYRHVLLDNPDLIYYRRLFESIKGFCFIQMSSIPMTFGLGFYVSLIVKRWWDQYRLLPWPDSLAIFVVGLIRGLDERGRMMRRNIMRYVLLSYVITLKRVSCRVHKRFPTQDLLVEAGLLTEDENKLMDALNEKCTVSKWWIPLVWATNIVDKARQEQRLNNDPGMQTVLNEISSIRKGLTGIQHYDTISVPLVYTQVVTLAVYMYFGAGLFGAQWVRPENERDYSVMYKLPTFHNLTIDDLDDSSRLNYQPLDMYIPVFLILQFVFYVGWLKVAETLINPFGEDDDDFELNYLIDRHIQVSYMIVDDMHQDFPTLLKDIHWNVPVPNLPYKEGTEHYRKEEPKGSAEVKEEAESMHYYRLSFPSFRHRRLSQSQAAGGAKPHLLRVPSRGEEGAVSSGAEYESIDPNLFGKMKAKIRKSMSRRKNSPNDNYNIGGNEDANSIYYLPPRRKSSLTSSSALSRKSPSQRSIYTKMFGNKFRRKSLDSRMDEKESVVVVDEGKLFDKLSHIEDEEQNEEGEENEDELMSNNRHLASHLSTIHEQSPHSTRQSKYSPKRYITAEALFADVEKVIPEESSKKTESAESNSYYPLGSDGSSGQRPVSPRFTVDEVPNYEPVLFGSNKATPAPVAAVKAESSTEKAGSESPVLPKRQPVVKELKNLSKTCSAPPAVMTLPDITVTRASSERRSPVPSLSNSSKSTSTEELSLEKSEIEDDQNVISNDDAFESATFYV